MPIISMKRKQTVTLESSFEQWRIHAEARNLAKATIRSYTTQFQKYYHWSKSKGYEIEDINTSTIEEYIIDLKKSETVSIVSINTALRHLKALIRHWQDIGHINAVVKITFLKDQEIPKEVYTEEELKILLKRPELKKCGFPELRTWAIINFFVGTGARVGTITAIQIGDYDRYAGVIQYRHTKSGRLQYIKVPSQLQQVLQIYLSFRGGEQEDYMFPSQNNTKLLQTTVTHNIKRYCKKRGIREGNSHLFRHTFAKNFILSGGDSLVLQQILGHQTLKMVEHYTKLWKLPIQNGFDKYNLLSKLSNEKIIIRKKNDKK